jgi:low temperature requirement protein LtrA
MGGRDLREAHRTLTPLELLFDLCFVVAVSQPAAQLHYARSGRRAQPTHHHHDATGLAPL